MQCGTVTTNRYLDQSRTLAERNLLTLIRRAIIGNDYLCSEAEVFDGGTSMVDANCQGLGLVQTGQQDGHLQATRRAARLSCETLVVCQVGHSSAAPSVTALIGEDL